MDEVTYFDNISIEVNAQLLLDKVQLRGSQRGSEDFVWAVEQAQDLIHPRLVVGSASVCVVDDTHVKIGNQEFTSRILQVNTEPCKKVYPFIGTIGSELENLAAEQKKLTRKFFLEMVGDYSLMLAVQQIEDKVKDLFSIDKIAVISPGELDNWPITQQVPLFNLFEAEAKRIGIELTSTMLMKPRKSRSGIWFNTNRGFIHCQLCKMKRCPGRKAKYRPEKYADYGLSIPS